MLDIETVTEFLGWCAIINIGILTISSLFVIILNTFAVKMHSKLFQVDKPFLDQEYFKYLAHFKILLIIFNIVPYFALKIII